MKPSDVKDYLDRKGEPQLKDGILVYDFLRRPYVKYEDIIPFAPLENELPKDVKEQVEIHIQYEGYINKAIRKAEKIKRMENKRIPEGIDYSVINGIATEAREKLAKIQPETIAQASRISGVNPSDISILMVYVEQGDIQKVKNA